jgi:putative copper resistance protein D
LGLAVVPRLDGLRYRDELARRAARPLAVAAGVWLVAELLRTVLAAAEAAAIPVTRLSVQTVLEFVSSTVAGRSTVFSLAAAGLVCALALFASPAPPVTVGIAGVAAAGVAARAVTGHVSENVVGATAVVVHALAAALWCGTLGALTFTVSSRGQWARVLPRFSQLALVCVAVLLAGGVVAAFARLGSAADLVGTGYGRILLAKIAVTAALLILAWTNRMGWLREARAHRVSADASLSRSLAEVGLMTTALTLAAALTLTG